MLNSIIKAWALVGGGLLLAIIVATTLNVAGLGIDRVTLALFDWPFPFYFQGYEELVKFFAGVSALMFLPWCQFERGHVAVDFLANRLGPRFNQFINLLSLAGFAALAIFLFYWMVPGMLQLRSDKAVSRILNWSEWWFYLPCLASLFLWFLVLLQQMVQTLWVPKRA
ncbi:MAG: TRAP transporter small permease [Alphaproteobacteria bacterium]